MKVHQFLELERHAKLPLLPAETYRSWSSAGLRIGCSKLGIYGLPTVELIDFLKSEIPDLNKAIEIGAGAGHLGRLLGVTMTDSFIQNDHEVRRVLNFMGSPVVPYGDDVEPLSALEAVDRYQPDVVVASWITQFAPPGYKSQEEVAASPFGVREDILISKVRKYIHIGNEGTHMSKFILKRPHRKIKAPWIVSRATYPAANVIYIWEKS